MTIKITVVDEAGKDVFEMALKAKREHLIRAGDELPDEGTVLACIYRVIESAGE